MGDMQECIVLDSDSAATVSPGVEYCERLDTYTEGLQFISSVRAQIALTNLQAADLKTTLEEIENARLTQPGPPLLTIADPTNSPPDGIGSIHVCLG